MMTTEPRIAIKVELLSNTGEELNGMFSIEERYEDIVRKARWLTYDNYWLNKRDLIPSNHRWKWIVETNIGVFLVTGDEEPNEFNKGLFWGLLEFIKNTWSKIVAGTADILTGPLVGFIEFLQKLTFDSNTLKKQKRK
jgi:hypothetical protein